MQDISKISKKLKETIALSKRTVKNVAEELGVHRVQLSRIIHGKATPSEFLLIRIKRFIRDNNFD